MVSAELKIKGFGVAECNSWMELRNQRTVLAAYEGLGECDAGVQQDFECANAGKSACGCVDFSISEGSSDIPARASAGRNGEVGSCAPVAL